MFPITTQSHYAELLQEDFKKRLIKINYSFQAEKSGDPSLCLNRPNMTASSSMPTVMELKTALLWVTTAWWLQSTQSMVRTRFQLDISLPLLLQQWFVCVHLKKLPVKKIAIQSIAALSLSLTRPHVKCTAAFSNCYFDNHQAPFDIMNMVDSHGSSMALQNWNEEPTAALVQRYLYATFPLEVNIVSGVKQNQFQAVWQAQSKPHLSKVK